MGYLSPQILLNGWGEIRHLPRFPALKSKAAANKTPAVMYSSAHLLEGSRFMSVKEKVFSYCIVIRIGVHLKPNHL